MAFFNAGPDPDDIYYDEDSGLFVDSESGDFYRDEDGTDKVDD